MELRHLQTTQSGAVKCSFKNKKNKEKVRELLECPVVVVRNSLHQVHFSARDAADGSVPVVSDPHVQVSGVEVLKVLIERDKILHR